MAAVLNIERRESGPAWRDGTADEAFVSAGAYAAAAAKHAKRFDRDDLIEAIQEMPCEALDALLHAVKVGNVKAAGALLVGRYRDRIAELAAWSAA